MNATIPFPCHLVSSLSDYQALVMAQADALDRLRQTEQRLTQQDPDSHLGMSWPAQAQVKLRLDHLYAEPGSINFRERLVCPLTGFNNRIRGALHVFESLIKPEAEARIYITEQVTALCRWLRRKYPGTEGSEYMTGAHWLNRMRFALKLFPARLNHQDLTQLTYPDATFDHLLSMDCLEHIPDYVKALVECHRVLRPGGSLLLSVPFDLNAADTLVRASHKADGSIEHHVEPEYHGNPMMRGGCLSYYTFGWDLLSQLNALGFSQTQAVIYWSEDWGYLGGPQVLIWARK